MYIETTPTDRLVTFRYQNNPDYGSEIIDFTQLKQDLVVTIQEQSGVWSADHSFAQIAEAVEQGVLVRLVDETNSRCAIIGEFGEDSFTFVTNDGQTCYAYTVTDADAWSLATSPVINIADDLTTDDPDKALSARQGARLASAIDYYKCTTAAATAAKVVTAPNYIATTGGCIKLKFTHKNTAASDVTLKIGSADAAPLYYFGAPVTNTNSWDDGDTLDVYFDGTNYYANDAKSAEFSTGEKVKKVGIDSAPTAGSANLVTSGGVKTQLDDQTAAIERRMKVIGDDVNTGIIAIATDFDFDSAVITQYYNRNNSSGDAQVIVLQYTVGGSTYTLRYGSGTGSVRSDMQTVALSRTNSSHPDNHAYLTVVWKPNIGVLGTPATIIKDNCKRLLADYAKTSEVEAKIAAANAGDMKVIIAEQQLGIIAIATDFDFQGATITQYYNRNNASGDAQVITAVFVINSVSVTFRYGSGPGSVRSDMQTVTLTSSTAGYTTLRVQMTVQWRPGIGVLSTPATIIADNCKRFISDIQTAVGEIDSELTALETTVGNIEDQVGDLIDTTTPLTVGEKYSKTYLNYGSTTLVTNVNGWSISDSIHLQAGDELTVQSRGTNQRAVFTKTDEEQTYYLTLEPYIGTGSVETHKYNADSECYICVCYRTADGLAATVKRYGRITQMEASIRKDYDETDFTTAGGVSTISGVGLEKGLWRLHAFCKINGYAETPGNHLVAQAGDYKVVLVGAANSRLTLPEFNVPSITPSFPVPKRNIHFALYNGATLISAGPDLSLPHFREIIGENAFRLRYLGTARNNSVTSATVQAEFAPLSDALTLSFVGQRLTITDGNTTYIDADVSGYTYVKDLVTYLQGVLTDFDVEYVGNDDMLTADLADIHDVVLVSQYQTPNNNLSSATTTNPYYDAFFCYFQQKVDQHAHSVEMVVEDGKLYATVDGLRLQTSPITVNADEITSITIGNNDGSCPIAADKIELNVAYLADAEPQSNGRVISNYNPNVILLMGHSLYVGSECDGKIPIHIGETPGPDEAAVAPPEYTVSSMSASDKRVMRIERMARNHGYQYIDMERIQSLFDGSLPKRCYSMIFDDHRQYFFDDLKLRAAFSRYQVNPALAVSFTPANTQSDDYKDIQHKLQMAGWELLMHSVKEVYLNSIPSDLLYDLTTKPTDPGYDVDTQWDAFNVQRMYAEDVDIDWGIWVYGSGSCNANVIKAFETQGVAIGIMNRYIDNNYYNCRATNQYYLGRKNIAEVVLFSSIEQTFV